MRQIAAVIGTATATFVITDALCAASGAANGAVGSAILKAAGHNGYDTLSATRNGAVGGAVLGLVVPALVNRALQPFSTPDANGRREQPWLLSMAAYTATAAAFTATGSAILQSAGHQNVMGAGRSAAAGAVGSAVLGAAGAALALAIVGSLLCIVGPAPRDNTMAMDPIA